MTIRKGEPWGAPGPLPDDGVVVRSDAEARAVVEAARRDKRPPPAIGLLGGDLWRTLGGHDAGEARLRSPEAMTFPVDLGVALLDGRVHVFVAHLVARSRGWGRAYVAANAQWRGDWNIGPKAHPNDGLLDTLDARLPGIRDRLKVRARLPTGSFLPHPAITARRTAAAQVDLPRPLAVELDGEEVGRFRSVVVRVEADALRVVV